jgi:MFS family permease
MRRPARSSATTSASRRLPASWAARHGDSDLAASLLRTSDAGDADARALQDISMKKRLSFVYIFSMVCLGLCYGAQGPATLALAEQCDIVKAANASSGKPIDASKLSQMGIATGMDALAGIFGTLIGGWCVDRVRRWHWVLCIYLIWQGLAFMSWTVVRSFPQLLVASLLWGFASTLPSFSTQAAMTWVWGKDVAPYMQLNNAGFGLGSLVAPLLVSAELRDRNSFHYGEQQGLSVSVSPLSLFFPPAPLSSMHSCRTRLTE